MKYTHKEYETPKINLMILSMEGPLCSSLNLGDKSDMSSEDLGDIFA